jgi:hypothetical protein
VGQFRRAWTLYQAIAFLALVPVSSYYVVTHGLPKKVLLFVIPAYIVMAWANYRSFKARSTPK